MSSPRIEDYGVIGDGRSAALVSRDGSIDWLCWPRFDSPSLFAALLDPTAAAARDRARPSRRPTRALRRRHQRARHDVRDRATAAEARLTDLMPVMLRGGEAPRRWSPSTSCSASSSACAARSRSSVPFQPRPDYARRAGPTARAPERSACALEDGPHLLHAALAMRRCAERRRRRPARGSPFGAGERLSLLADLRHRRARGAAAARARARRGDSRAAIAWWRGWAAVHVRTGRTATQVVRSVLALKLLSFAPSGAIVAAPTTSLPERIGGDLNWDYRFCWLRDASLTARALFDLGYRRRGRGVLRLAAARDAADPARAAVLYDVYGELPAPTSRRSTHLAGYRGSRPVRVGNAAAGQLQLDVYGEVIDAVAQLVPARRPPRPRDAGACCGGSGDYVCEHWREPDQGIWEPREPPRHHTHSRVLCWVALDRLLELHERGALAPTRRAAKLRAASAPRSARDDRAPRLRTPRSAATRQVLDGDTVDASLLLLCLVRLRAARAIRACAPRFDASASGSRRRRRCSTATSESRAARRGRVRHLQLLGGRVPRRAAAARSTRRERRSSACCAYANDVGLFAEEIDPVTGERARATFRRRSPTSG